MPHRRIDTHHHIVPPAYAAWLRDNGIQDAGGRELSEWSVDGALAVMDQYDIAAAIVSLSTPGVHLDPSKVVDPVATMTQRAPVEVLDDFASFWFDTALSGSPAALPSLLAFAKPGHVLFGSDWPYAPAPLVGYFTGQVDAYAALDDTGHAALDRGNAEALFPRLFAVGPR